jgi:predicted ATPase
MINEVRLRNFKCFAEAAIPCRALTVLAGVNGSGKSSFLQAMLLLRQSHRASTGFAELVVDGEYINLGTARDVFFQHAGDEILEIALADGAHEVAMLRRWQFTYDQGLNTLASLPDALDSVVPMFALFGDEFQYLEAERIGPRTIASVPVRRSRERGLGNKGEFTAYHLAIFGDTPISNPRLLHSKESRPALVRQVEAWLGEISPGTQLTVSPHLSMDLVQLQFSYPAGRTVTAELRPTNVGFGISYALPLVTAVLSAKPNSCLILENPEAHLHPRGQAQLGRLIAKACRSDVQIFVETHSDHLLNGIRLAVRDGDVDADQVSLLFFSRDSSSDAPGASSIASPRIDRDGRIDHWPTGFFDEYMKASMDLLRPSRRANTGGS